MIVHPLSCSDQSANVSAVTTKVPAQHRVNAIGVSCVLWSVETVSATIESVKDDAAAIEVLYAQHYRELVRLVSGLLDDDGECEEIVQEVFVRLARGRVGPRRGSEAAYLRSAALNGARSRLRKRRVRRSTRLRAVPDPDIADAATERVEHSRVLDVIRQLPKRQAEVLLLRYQAELSEVEIAETLGISTGSVKTHSSRGLAAVRSKLGVQS